MCAMVDRNTGHHPMSNESTEIMYTVDHLATFTVGENFGLLYPADGLRRLRQMERTSGVWTQRMYLKIEPHAAVLIDYDNNDPVEKFQMQFLHEPTAFFSDDPSELYNNLLVFTVRSEDAAKSPSEMHLFHCLRASADRVAEELRYALRRIRDQRGAKLAYINGVPQAPPMPNDSKPKMGISVREAVRELNHVISAKRSASPSHLLQPNDGNNANYRRSPSEHSSAGAEYNKNRRFMSNGRVNGNVINAAAPLTDDIEDYERDVHVLNRCFDDIEAFVARLQMAYAARDELERRKRFAQKKKTKPKADALANDHILIQRARLPPERDFVDVLQKFKLSFNLLAKLRGQIHDPNAPELVHFLFTPLAMIVDATQHASMHPVLGEWYGLPDLAQRVLNPLLTQEAINLLHNCLTSKEFDLWKTLGDAWNIPKENWRGPPVPAYKPVFYSGWEPYGTNNANGTSNGVSNGVHAGPTPVAHDIDWRSASPALRSQDERVALAALSEVERRQRHWVDELEQSGARMVHVIYPRTGANEKELSVQRGEVLQVLDSTRNWWKLKNWRGDVGFAPHTILAAYPPPAHH